MLFRGKAYEKLIERKCRPKANKALLIEEARRVGNRRLPRSSGVTDMKAICFQRRKISIFLSYRCQFSISKGFNVVLCGTVDKILTHNESIQDILGIVKRIASTVRPATEIPAKMPRIPNCMRRCATAAHPSGNHWLLGQCLQLLLCARQLEDYRAARARSSIRAGWSSRRR